LVTSAWTQQEHQHFLGVIRAHWRGWNIVLFEDRASQHTATGSLWVADACDLAIRWVPEGTPPFNAMGNPWEQVKRNVLADRPTISIDESALCACDQIMAMRPHDRLRQAGVLSGNFWLTM